MKGFLVADVLGGILTGSLVVISDAVADARRTTGAYLATSASRTARWPFASVLPF